MQKKTYVTKKSDITIGWRVIDGQDKILGRLAAEIVVILLGKDKSYYVKNMVCGDKVVIINASGIKVTGNKVEDKVYVRHSGYMGGLKKETYGDLEKRRPGEVLRKAVAGMLPRNTLRKNLIANLYIYQGAEHPHHGQVSQKGI
ncbi:50S ribosomal protein L13 [candidate division WWE3 bacterium CG08_land_8_20_14_0_20_40_13]|uniref:Large ribosomal subunit protein uL13 n=1 Tax=candidate division WWE3 bacterium CG08_land_8_20_14_0_20_40_13 TaxID=1975084 RepID=A0A2H0XER9_UNCKA|nr:MAG: 50S ribosomal protein L13 [candidate division WWE3 bacterium CG08_land_8_20_14_0_20_40_13]